MTSQAIAVIPTSPTSWMVCITHGKSVAIADSWELRPGISDFGAAIAALDGDFLPRGFRRVEGQEEIKALGIIQEMLSASAN